MAEYGVLRVFLEVWFKDINGVMKRSRVTLYKDYSVTAGQARGYFLDIKGMQREEDRSSVHYTFTING